MALDAKHRSSIFGKFLPLLGEDDANALMSEFPASESDQLVTQEFLRAELALTRGDLRSEMADLSASLRSEMVELSTSLRSEMVELSTALRAETAGLRTEMADRFQQQTVRMYAAIGLAVAVLGTLTRIG